MKIIKTKSLKLTKKYLEKGGTQSDYRLQAKWDILLNEKTKLRNFDNLKHKLGYLFEMIIRR